MRTGNYLIAGLISFWASLFVGYAADMSRQEADRRHFPDLGFSMCVPTNAGPVTCSSSGVVFTVVMTNAVYARNGASGEYTLKFMINPMTQEVFKKRIMWALPKHETLSSEFAALRTNATVISRLSTVRRDATRADGVIFSAYAGCEIQNVLVSDPRPEDLDLMKVLLDSIRVEDKRVPRQAPGSTAPKPADPQH